MAVKQVFDGDSAKLRAEHAKILQSEKALTAALVALTKESEKSEKSALREAEAKKKATLATKEAVEENRKLTTETSRQAKEVDRLKDKLEKQRNAQNGVYASGIAGLRTWALGYVSLNTAAQVFTATLERQQKLAEKSQSAQQRTAGWQAKIIANNPGQSQAHYQKLFRDIEAAAIKARAPDMAAFGETVAATTAATGGDVPGAIRSSAATIRVTRQMPGDSEAISSAAAEIAKNSGLSEEASIGLLYQYGGVTRQPDTATFARSLTEGIAAAAGTSTDRAAATEWALERMATVSNRTGDVTGKTSAQAILNEAIKLERFFKVEHPELADPGTPGLREKYLQDNPALAKEFIAGMGGELASYVPIRDTFAPGTETYQQMIANEKAIDRVSAQQVFDATATAMEGASPELAAQDVMAGHAGQTERAFGDSPLVNRRNAQTIVEDSLTAGSDGTFSQSFAGWSAQKSYDWRVAFGADPISAGEDAIVSQMGIASGQAALQETPMTAEQSRIVAILQENLAELRALRRTQEAPSHTVDTGVRQ